MLTSPNIYPHKTGYMHSPTLDYHSQNNFNDTFMYLVGLLLDGQISEGELTDSFIQNVIFLCT